MSNFVVKMYGSVLTIYIGVLLMEIWQYIIIRIGYYNVI